MIRRIEAADRALFLELAHEFYGSGAALVAAGPEDFERTFSELMRSDDYAEAYLFEEEGEPAGYALLAKTYSQEAGGMVLWLEEIYVRPAFRSRGVGGAFFAFMEEHLLPGYKRVRLEVEAENEGAARLYRKKGFSHLPYMAMVREL